MDGSRKIDDPHDFSEFAPAGFYLAVRVGFAFPEHERNELPLGWVYAYTHNALMLYDPVTRWMYENVGFVRWNEIGLDDPRGVLALAAEHGLKHGAAICVLDADSPGVRTFGSFARSDREFKTDEMEFLHQRLAELHRPEPLQNSLTEIEIEALQLIRDGHLTKQIAYDLGISESAVKQRIRNAKKKLRAKTSTHAVTLAERKGLLRSI